MHLECAWGVSNASRMRLGPIATTYGHFFENRKNREKNRFFRFWGAHFGEDFGQKWRSERDSEVEKSLFFFNEALNQKSETVNRKLCPWSIQNSSGDAKDHKLAMPPHFETTPQNVVFRGSD